MSWKIICVYTQWQARSNSFPVTSNYDTTIKKQFHNISIYCTVLYPKWLNDLYIILLWQIMHDMLQWMVWCSNLTVFNFSLFYPFNQCNSNIFQVFFIFELSIYQKKVNLKDILDYIPINPWKLSCTMLML